MTDGEIKKFEERLIQTLKKKAEEDKDTPDTAPKHVKFDYLKREWTFIAKHFTKFRFD